MTSVYLSPPAEGKKLADLAFAYATWHVLDSLRGQQASLWEEKRLPGLGFRTGRLRHPDAQQLNWPENQLALVWHTSDASVGRWLDRVCTEFMCQSFKLDSQREAVFGTWALKVLLKVR